jgi:4-amino-4-deoxy-L-arabinose transferase-like glycosyltransferase
MRGVAPIAATLLLAGGSALFWLERRGGHEAVAVALWIALQAVAVVAALLEAPRRPPADPSARLKTALLAAALVVLGGLVIGWHLATVPQDVHNDVGATVEAARALEEGRRGLFQPGYAEIPGPGSLPTAVSLRLFGNTMVGGRAGAAAVGILAVLGVFALGRELRNERTGFFAGLLLCGSVPFVHYARLTPFGEVTAFSVWLLWGVLKAARADRPAAWLAAGVLGGWGLLLFYSARVSLVGAVVAAALLLLRPLRNAPRRLALMPLFVVGMAAVLSPVVPVWIERPEALFHRMAESFSLYDPATGFHPEVLGRVAGEPAVRTLSMFWPVLSPEKGGDLAGQGTLGSAMGPVEGVLLAAGLLLALVDGWETAVLLLVWLAIMLLGCGVFAQATPWYSRLVPVMAVAALLMARAADALVSLVPARGAWRRIAAAAAAAAIFISVTLPNVRRYVRFEEGRSPSIYTAFRLAADRLPAGTRICCVTFERPDFTCRHPSFGPFLARPRTGDVSNLADVLPVPAGQSAAFFIPLERFIPDPRDPKLLIEEIRRFHPDATVLRVAPFPGDPYNPRGLVVVVGPEAAKSGPG